MSVAEAVGTKAERKLTSMREASAMLLLFTP
jgi:hypothetical protein